MDFNRWDQFDIQKAVIFAQLSELAYIRFEDSPENMASLESSLLKMNFQLNKTFNHSGTDTQCFLAKHDCFNVLVFRGTEERGLDILSDLKASLCEEYGGHSGFYGGYRSIQSEVKKELALDCRPLILTGHSLGGALAKVCLLLEKDIPIAACYTFGSPPVCPKSQMLGVGTPVFLLVYGGDIVPRIMIAGGPAVKAVLWIIRSFSRVLTWFGWSNEAIEGLFGQIESLRRDLLKYDHFPGIYWIDAGGKIKSLKSASESLSMAFGIWIPGWKKAFEDHAIRGYIVALENLRNQTVDSRIE